MTDQSPEDTEKNMSAPEESLELDSQDTTQTQSAADSQGAQILAGLQAKLGTIEQTQFGTFKYISIEQEMRKSYLDYAMSVIVSRALPDVRDGLKPVHRRILYSMYKSGIHHSSSYKKSARIVGDVMGRYHPHGDAPVYMAMVRLAQDFSMRYMLIDGQGNYGSVDGDSPAAMRYTEARLAKITRELLLDIDKETVPFVDNFDGSLKEPTVLPAKLPNLLLMGSEGIAVGMATKIPPHNLTEVCNAIISMIEQGTARPDEKTAKEVTELLASKAAHKGKKTKIEGYTGEAIQALLNVPPELLAGEFDSEATNDSLMQHIKGPDFPTGGIIYDAAAIKEAYRTGRGSITIRAKASIEETKKGYQIVVTEIPYQVNKARLLMSIAKLVRDKKVEGIKDLNDDSDRNGLQITIELKRDAKPKVVLNKLFKYSELQTSFALNMVALNSQGTPQLMTIRTIIKEYICHRQLVIVKRSQSELKIARDRAHILEGLLIALANLDDVIDTIRRSPDTETAKTALMQKFALSEIQSQAILEMQLKRLAALERQKIESEYQEVQATISKLFELLANPVAIMGVLKSEIDSLIQEYGDDRKTQVISGKVGEFSEEDLIPNVPTMITLTETGYIKRLDPNTYRSQSRGGKGSIGIKMKAEDMIKHLITANAHDSLLVFSNSGKVFKLKAHEIPEASRQAKGTAIVNLINLTPEERVQSIMVVDTTKDADKFIALATKDGLVKKTQVKLYENIRQNGIVAIVLNDGDELVWGKLTSGSDDLMLITRQGKSIRFSETEVKASQRDTKGVRGITLTKDDYVIGVEALNQEEDIKNGADKKRQLLLITENGMGKRTALDQYPIQKRSGMGVKVAEITKKTGPVANVQKVTPDITAVVISSKDGQTIKLPMKKSSIPILTRPTQGVILMRLNDGDKVVAVTLTQDIEEEEQNSDVSPS